VVHHAKCSCSGAGGFVVRVKVGQGGVGGVGGVGQGGFVVNYAE